MLKKTKENENKIAPTELVREIKILFGNKKFDEALILGLEIIKNYPDIAIIHNILGIIFFHKNTFNQSLHHFKVALELDCTNSDTYNNLGICLIEMKQYEDAIRILKYALLNNKKSPEIFNNIGVAYKELEDYETSILYYKKAIKQKKNYAEAYNNLGSVLQKMKKYANAKKFLNYAIKFDPKLEDAYHNIGKLNDITGNFMLAKAGYQKAISLNPRNSKHYIELGKIYLKELNFRISKLYFEKAIEINPEEAEAYSSLGYIFINEGHISKAFKFVNKSKLIDRTLVKSSLILDNIHFLISNFIHNPNSYYLPRYFGKIKKETIFEFMKDNKIDIKKNNYKINFEKIYTNALEEDFIENQINNNKNLKVCLLGFGRSGSLFLHSLFDGHPQISTLPGYFFKGWFNEKTWPIFKPNFQDTNWREILAEKICVYFEPQFNANSKKNVIGEPNGEATWLAYNTGFTQLGEKQSEVLELDQKKFKKNFVELSQSYNSLNQDICFELIHEAFDKAYRMPGNSSKKNKIIFYHLHNPSYFERANFHYHYPDNKSLFIIRHPIKMIESWMLSSLKFSPLPEDNPSFNDNYHFINILNCGATISLTLEYFLNPFNSMTNVRAIKLEDLKRNPKKALKQICEWIGIKDNPLLYQSTFMGKLFSRPSVNFNNIKGFDTRSIDVPLGRVFGKKDIKILETLFWPFMDIHGYTTMSKEKFLKNLQEIRPYLDKPLQFEMDIYKKLPNDKPDISKIYQFNELHRELINIWEILNETKTYPNLIKPLVI